MNRLLMPKLKDGMINAAAICSGIRSLGPGVRGVLWVQGCLFRCPGCISPEWIPFRENLLLPVEEVVDRLLSNPHVSGLTFSGGEPMLQAVSLAWVARLARRQKPDLNIISFSGFTLAQLKQSLNQPGIADFLAELDVLIDGQYVQKKNDNLGLRGSSNQVIHYLTDRLADANLEAAPRNTEFYIYNEEAMLVGVPSPAAHQAFETAIRSLPAAMGTGNDERA